MTPIKFLTNELNKFYEEFPYIEIRYEYRESINTHIIEVRPEKSFEEDKVVINYQIDLEDDFESIFPSESILFITDNELISIKNPILELGASYKECVYETITAPFKIDFAFQEIDKFINDYDKYIDNAPIDGSFVIPEFSSPPKKKWYKILIKPKDLECIQGLFFISL